MNNTLGIDALPSAKDRIIDPEVKLSVHIITYNQEKYISRALQGVVDQKVNFRFEVVIGDDFSLDGTRKIIQEFTSKYPKIFRPLFHPYNLGPKGIEGKYNFITTFYACRGKHIALLDGDDYWNDANKLQKQVDFLEANPDYAICFHGIYEMDQNGNPTVCTRNLGTTESTLTIEDLAKENVIYTPSVVFRNNLFHEFPELFMKSPVGDYWLHLLNAKQGKIKYLPDLMATYKSCAWLSLAEEERYKKWILTLELLMKGDFSGNIISVLKQQLMISTELYLQVLLQSCEYEKFSCELKKHLRKFPEKIDKWAEFLPNFIKNIVESRTYKLSRRIATVVRRFRTCFAFFK